MFLGLIIIDRVVFCHRHPAVQQSQESLEANMSKFRDDPKAVGVWTRVRALMLEFGVQEIQPHCSSGMKRSQSLQ